MSVKPHVIYKGRSLREHEHDANGTQNMGLEADRDVRGARMQPERTTAALCQQQEERAGKSEVISADHLLKSLIQVHVHEARACVDHVLEATDRMMRESRWWRESWMRRENHVRVGRAATSYSTRECHVMKESQVMRECHSARESHATRYSHTTREHTASPTMRHRKHSRASATECYREHTQMLTAEEYGPNLLARIQNMWACVYTSAGACTGVFARARTYACMSIVRVHACMCRVRMHACTLCGRMLACDCVHVRSVGARAHVCMCECVCACACACLRVHVRMRVCVRGWAHAC